ncbi:uncharacterized protein [Choristoneura fumiferana]|uniref:uncharacterized protein n=1 Tax=Choristoneura fumiferana TaxID=7141 RepID=UPI003D156D3A
MAEEKDLTKKRGSYKGRLTVFATYLNSLDASKLTSTETLGEPVEHWDTLLIHLVTQKLDSKTFREWEESKSHFDKNKPNKITFDTLKTFIRDRADFLETLEMSNNQANSSNKSSHKIKSMFAVRDNRNNRIDNNNNHGPSSPTKPCPSCKGDHYLNGCPRFLALTNTARLQLLSNYKVCHNCFRSGHYATQCKKPGCKICKRKHHTLIHITEFKPTPTVNNDRYTDPQVHASSHGGGERTTELVHQKSITAGAGADPGAPVTLSANVSTA